MLIPLLISSATEPLEYVGSVNADLSTNTSSGEPEVDISSLNPQEGDYCIFVFVASPWPSAVSVSGFTGGVTELEDFENNICQFGIYSKRLDGTETTITASTTGEGSEYCWVAGAFVWRNQKQSYVTTVNTTPNPDELAETFNTGEEGLFLHASVEGSPGAVSGDSNYSSIFSLSTAATVGSGDASAALDASRATYSSTTSETLTAFSWDTDREDARLYRIEGYV